MDNVTVISDAELINQYSKAALEEPAPEIKTQAPPESSVTLLAGAIVNGSIELNAEVRELNGADEEAIARAGSLGKSLTTILHRGVVNIGGATATEDILNGMLSGDRDLLMLAIRKITFGDKVSGGVFCDSCGKYTDVEVDLNADIPIKPFNGKWSWDVETKLGTVTVAFYNGLTQRRIMDNLDKTGPEINTLLLAGCIQAVDGYPVIAADFAKKIGIMDREKILFEVLNEAPGPRLSEVTKACEACGTDIPVPLSLASLFRL